MNYNEDLWKARLTSLLIFSRHNLRHYTGKIMAVFMHLSGLMKAGREFRWNFFVKCYAQEIFKGFLTVLHIS